MSDKNDVAELPRPFRRFAGWGVPIEGGGDFAHAIWRIPLPGVGWVSGPMCFRAGRGEHRTAPGDTPRCSHCRGEVAAFYENEETDDER
ncbi:hypothetical protein KBTX_02785 [wastewater metagenome]|uniref:Uncharacterized protein n=2 Tax=unclassified sequences TaxID=12908 RepID=A0A5B8RI61_9ZZZZ|nr:hypothetical protein KBTEX_02785 [uncultured organism]